MNKDITNKPLETKSNVRGTSAEVEVRAFDLGESHANAALLNKIRAAFMKTCGMPNKDFVDTEAMSKPKSLIACAMNWKNNAMKMPVLAMMRNPLMAKVLTEAMSDEELKTMKAYLKTLGEDDTADIVKVSKAMMTFNQASQETLNWQDIESPNREEYAAAKTKKEWEKVDKKELDRDTKKEKEEHEKDAVKDDDSKIKKLEKGKPSVKKDVEIHDLKKDQEFDKEDKIKYSKAESDKERQERMDRDEDDQDDDSLKKENKKEKEKHYKDAVKEDKKEVKDLKKDIKEDKKSEKEASAELTPAQKKLPPGIQKAILKKQKNKDGDEKDDKDESEDKEKKEAKADYSDYWQYAEDYAEERYNGKTRSELKDSVFLDPKRRSFPVVNCKNVQAAVSTWGMYKGSMSYEEFKRKLTSRAKKLGCDSALPDSWKDE